MKIEEVFQAGEDTSLESILNKLVEKKDIELKTEITSPLAITRLRLLAFMGEQKGFTQTAATLNKLAELYMLHMVSYKRGGRKEVIDGFASILAHQERMKGKDQWMGNRNNGGMP